MANAAILSTCDVSTAVAREQQPLALTTQQKEGIERTWKMVEDSGLMDAGIELFKHIFTICPSAQKMFKKFCDVPFEELPDNEHFCSHGLHVTESISLAVSAINDVEFLESVLKDLGAAHSTHGLNDSYFDVVGQSLIATLSEGLGEEFTEEIKEAYVKFYGFITRTMKEGLNEATSGQE